MKRFVFAGALALAAGGQALAADLPPPMAPPPRAPATYVPAPVPIFTWPGSISVSTAATASGPRQPPAAAAASAPTASWPAARSAATTSSATSWSASRAMATGPTSTAPALRRLRSQKHLAGHRARPRRLCLGPRVVLWHGRRRVWQRAGRCESAGPSTARRKRAGPRARGIEAAFAPNWTAKVEYLYVDFAGLSCTALVAAPATP